MVRYGFWAVLILVLLVVTQTPVAAQLATFDDARTGVRLPIPKSLIGRHKSPPHGSAWTFQRGDMNIDTLQFPPERTLSALQEKLAQVRGRTLSRNTLDGNVLILEGIDADRRQFFVRIEEAPDGTKRGISIIHRPWKRRAARLAESVKHGFVAFPQGMPSSDTRFARDTNASPAVAEACIDEAATLSRLAVTVRVDVTEHVNRGIPIGAPTTIRWSFSGALNETCRRPLYLVVTAPKRTRFEGTGFLAIPGGALGPFDIKYNSDQTRLFFPLHLLDETQGAFKIKSYEVGALNIQWALVQAKSKISNPRTKDDFALGEEYVSDIVKLANVARYTAGEPQIVVRDNFTLDQPKKVIRSNSGEFDLQVFDKFYRVLNAKTGELVLERAGIDPNFSPGSRFVAAFIEGGNSRHLFSDLEAPNAEILDLYSLARIVAEKPLFLSWGHGDTFFAPGEVPCLRNSCSARLVVYSSLVDDGPIPQVGMSLTYKSFPLDFQISIDLEMALVNFRGIEDRARSNGREWASLISVFLDSTKLGEGLRESVQSRLRIAAFKKNKPDFEEVNTSRTSLDWYAQGRRFAVSQHCIPNKENGCAGGTEQLYGLAKYRIQHAMRADGPFATEHLSSGLSRLTMSRAARTGLSETIVKGSRTGILARVDSLISNVSIGSRIKSRLLSYKYDLGGDNSDAHVGEIKRDVATVSPLAAALLPGAKKAQELAERTGGGCMVKKQDFDGLGRLPTVITHYIQQMRAWKAGRHAGWAFRMECTNGASGRYWLWALLATEGKQPAIVDLSYEFRLRIGPHSAQVSGAETDPYFDWSWDWPQTVEGLEISGGRYLLAHGAWPKGRWAIVFDLDTRKPVTFLPGLQAADDFGQLALTQDGRTLVQANTNGQIFFYDTATSKVILRGVETDDELIIYDDNGYYLSSPEGGQFLNLKFPGIAGYSSVAQFASTLNKPDAIKAILAGRPALAKPNLTAPPELRIATTVDGSGGARRAKLNYETGSEVGLKELIVFVDGRPVQTAPLAGERHNGTVEIALAPEARWISAVTVDRSGYRSIARGQELSGVAQPDTSRLFAITVGTDIYNDPGISKLGAAKRDASSFGQLVTSVKGGLYSDVQLAPYLDETDLKPKLLGRLREVVATAGPHDTIMLFAAAHGDQGRDGKFYLVTRDSEKGNLENTAISWDDIAAALRGVRARVIVFLDACRSGAAGGSGTNDDAVAALLSRDAPITVIAASKGRQNSEETNLGGYFTNEIVRAVAVERAQTDTNGNGAIELAELYAAIKPRVVRATENNDVEGKQTPWIARNQMVGEIPLF